MNLMLWKDTNVYECLSGGCSLLRTHRTAPGCRW